MWLPGLIGVLAVTDALNYAASRNFVLIMYSVFALIAALVTRLTTTYRWWFIAVLVGSTIALLLVITGHAGPEGETSTGAIRLASHTFALAFGIAPIVLIAAARERLVPFLVAACGTAAFLVGLVFVNHRSTWLAFVAAAVILFGSRLTPAVVIGGLAVLVIGGFLFSAPPTSSTIFGQEITRAKSVADTDDPNARFRLSFWKHALSRSIDSPFIGSGFDPYPPDLVPPKTSRDDPFTGPHNSFVALGYRLGIVPLLALLFLLGALLRRGFYISVHATSRQYRAICAALTAIVVYTGIASAFNVFLEAPYAGPLFWTTVGLLAVAAYAPGINESDASAREGHANAQHER
jgi:O-antigen ligase